MSITRDEIRVAVQELVEAALEYGDWEPEEVNTSKNLKQKEDKVYELIDKIFDLMEGVKHLWE